MAAGDTSWVWPTSDVKADINDAAQIAGTGSETCATMARRRTCLCGQWNCIAAGRRMTVDRALLWPFLPDYVEQVVVNTDLSVSHKMKFAPNRLLPIGHANELRLHEGKSFLSQIELPEAAAARAFVTRR